MGSSICIYGAGAVGLDLAWNCIRSGYDVTIIARGSTLEALRLVGIVNETAERELIPPSKFRVFSSSQHAGAHDIVFITTKVDSLLEVAPEIPPLLSPDSVVISATNGIPPWYSYLQEATIGRFSFPLEPRTQFLQSVPGHLLIGGIVERSCELGAPGIIRKATGKGYTIGELDHTHSDRSGQIQELLNHAGFKVTISDNIHRDIWLKLIGNIAVNPLSVLTQSNIGEMLCDRLVRQRMISAARQAESVGIRLGVINTGDFNEESFLSTMAEKLGTHRPSMLQDFEKGKPLEVPRILGVVEMLANAPGPTARVDSSIITELRNEIEYRLGRPKVVPLSP